MKKQDLAGLNESTLALPGKAIWKFQMNAETKDRGTAFQAKASWKISLKNWPNEIKSQCRVIDDLWPQVL
jgi:hypothetical protein